MTRIQLTSENEVAGAWSPPRKFTYRPPDPSWANRGVLHKVRCALKAMDFKLDVWWIPGQRPDDGEQSGRWAVFYWMANAQQWSCVFTWEDAAGGFRNMDLDCRDRLKAMLAASEGNPREINRKAEEAAEEEKRKKRQERYDNCAEYIEDLRDRTLGVKQTFGPGHVRSRRFLRNAETDEHDSNHRKYLEDEGLTG